MKISVEKELTELISKIVDSMTTVQQSNQDIQSKTVESFKGVISNTDRIIDLIESINKTVTVMTFFITILFWKVFLWKPFNSLLDNFIETWSTLSENYKILILGFIGTAIAGIIAHIAGSLILEKIKKSLGK